MTTALSTSDLTAFQVVQWQDAIALTGMHDRLLRRRCADLNIPEIKFTQRSRGILLPDFWKLIAAHAIPIINTDRATALADATADVPAHRPSLHEVA